MLHTAGDACSNLVSRLFIGKRSLLVTLQISLQTNERKQDPPGERPGGHSLRSNLRHVILGGG